MAVKTNQVLQSGFTLTTSGDSIYSAGTGIVRAAIDQCVFTNHGTTPVNIDVHIVQNGDSADNTNKVISNQALAVDETFTPPEVISCVINSGGSVYAVADTADSVNVVLYGTVYTS